MFADDSYLFGDLDTILPIAKKWIRAIKRAGLQTLEKYGEIFRRLFGII